MSGTDRKFNPERIARSIMATAYGTAQNSIRLNSNVHRRAVVLSGAGFDFRARVSIALVGQIPSRRCLWSLDRD